MLEGLYISGWFFKGNDLRMVMDKRNRHLKHSSYWKMLTNHWSW